MVISFSTRLALIPSISGVIWSVLTLFTLAYLLRLLSRQFSGPCLIRLGTPKASETQFLRCASSTSLFTFLSMAIEAIAG